MVEESYYKNWLEEHFPFNHKDDLELLYDILEECYENGYYKNYNLKKDTNMITLAQLIQSTTWLQPQDHMKISLWDKSKIYEEGEFVDLELNVRNLAKYGNYWVDDIDIEVCEGDKPVLACMIWKD